MSEIAQQTQELTTIDHFAPFEAQAKEWMEKASQITVTDESQIELMAGAKEARLALKRIRGGIEATRKDLKEDYLRRGNEIQQIANRLKNLIEPIEAHLQEQEDFAKVQEVKRKKVLFDHRMELLKPLIGEDQARMFPLDEMNDFAFDTMLNGYKMAREAKERYDAEMIEIDRKAKEAKQAEEKLIREDNERQQKVIKQQEEKLQKERSERKRLENEAAAKLAKEESEKKQKLAEERKAKRQPDKVKLLAFADQLEIMPLPELKEQESREILLSISGLMAKIVKFVKEKAETL